MESPPGSQHYLPRASSAVSQSHLTADPPNRPPSPALSRLSLESRISPVHSLSEDHEGFQPDPLQDVRGVKVAVNRKLDWWDVSALIINKMIGTGIFTGPPTVLLYTGNKNSALCLWAGGFAYTLISMSLYLEYARKLPYTGGELVYLDQILPRPVLLSYTCYALYFVCMYTTTTNSMQFARQVISAATNDTTIHDQRVMRFIAVVITTVICLLIYFSTATGRRLNRYLAWLKIGLLLSVFMAGAVKAGKSTVHDNAPAQMIIKSSSAAGLLQVLFSFQGWENATLVAGEIPDYQTLRKGFIRAVWIVGLLYMLINIVFCYAIPWGPDGNLNLDYVTIFFGGSPKAKQAWAVLIAFSAVGSMISVTYTCVMVKQTIAWANILPWSSFWRRSAPVRVEEPKDAYEMERMIAQRDDHGDRVSTWRTAAPQGGIILHWIACIFYICVSSSISVVSEASSFSGYLLTYAHAIAGGILGLFFYRLRNVKDDIPPDRNWLGPKDHKLPWWLAPRPCQFLFGWTYAAGSITILVLVAVGPYLNTDGTTRTVKGWYFTVITWSFFMFSLLYYFAFLWRENTTAVHLAGVKLRRQEHGVDDNENMMRQCDLCRQHKPGEGHRNAIYGYLYYNELNFHSKEKGRNFLYWVFGGPKERHHPNLNIDDYIVTSKKNTARIFRAIWTPVRGLIPGLRSSGRS